ncbi:MAG TPA: hypothetical protein VHX39_23365 [Acetobacteraceae bacterium]|nr:hypothetical protein [Acetobacteraceae bacterium]
MTDFGIARAVHLVMVVLWIGGVGMVTTVLLPRIRRSHLPNERFGVFHAIEARFANQARWTTGLAGLSGLYMVWRIDAWDRFTSANFWWMHAMVATWLVFTLMLFVAEPFFLDRWLERRAVRDPEAAYRLVERLHWMLLTLGLVTIAGAAAGVAGVNLAAF